MLVASLHTTGDGGNVGGRNDTLQEASNVLQGPKNKKMSLRKLATLAGSSAKKRNLRLTHMLRFLLAGAHCITEETQACTSSHA